MAWRSNIPQKSFLCERLFIPSEEWFVFYMQMTISTTGRRQLCILCSVCVLSKMLKLCGAEGSSFRWLMGAGSCFCEFHPICFWSGSRCWAVFCLLEVHQIDPLWCCCQALTDAFSGWDPLEFRGGSRFWSSILDTVNRLCWSSIGATVRGTIFGCCQLFVGGSASWCFHQTHWLLGLVRVVGKECPLLRSFRFFWSGSLPMLSVLRWGLSNGELAVARTIWRVSVVGDVRSLFDYLQLLLRSIRFLVSEVDLFAVEISQTLFLR